MARRAIAAVLAALLALTGLVAGSVAASADDGKHYAGEFDGVPYRVEVPAGWNGTLLLFSGVLYNGQLGLATYAATEQWALGHGYALAGTPKSWDVGAGLQSQLAVLDWFEQHIGIPRHTVSWGTSLGGLTAVVLAERSPGRVDGVVSLCGPLAGTVSTWNGLLDLNFAIKTLLAPDSDLELVHISDPAANQQKLQQIVEGALASPQGRARLALANALADVPGWFTALQPRATDVEAQVRQQGAFDVAAFDITGGGMRADIERQAGGNPSWNAGVDYRRLLTHSSERRLVRQAYHQAGGDLSADLDRLAKAARIRADERAVAYLARSGTPRGTTPAPVVTLHTTGDVLAVPEHERHYAQQVRRFGDPAELRQLFVERGGHCTYTPSEEIVSLQAVLHRIDTGRWADTSPARLTAAANQFGSQYQRVLDWATASVGSVQPAFVPYTPGRFLRPFPL
ncbi:MAG TPA: alpha/beta fold hydrolase [Actinomycetes bacterium]|jgi:pimeloyl-ACP methyl ester carboxylesterase|nr:alpha/beta fold hydrolase [Actinomycetes bacterium]